MSNFLLFIVFVFDLKSVSLRFSKTYLSPVTNILQMVYTLEKQKFDFLLFQSIKTVDYSIFLCFGWACLFGYHEQIHYLVSTIVDVLNESDYVVFKTHF